MVLKGMGGKLQSALEGVKKKLVAPAPKKKLQVLPRNPKKVY